MPAGGSGDEPVFGHDSEIWGINRWRSGLLFGPQAVLLQVAHPRIAQGVAEHSDFRRDTLGRLRRTLATVNAIAFGTRAEAQQAQARLNAVHQRVRGRTAPGIDGPPDYSAFDEDLMFWVLATLVDASIRGHEFVWGPLAAPRQERFYQEMRAFGEWCGMRADYGPADHAAFANWFAAALEDPQLGSHPLCAEIAAAVVRPVTPAAARLLGWAADFLPVETVPPAIRARLGLRSTPSTRLRMRLLRIAAPLLFRALPHRLTWYPEAWRAARVRGWRWR